jgi:hypothetical protein
MLSRLVEQHLCPDPARRSGKGYIDFECLKEEGLAVKSEHMAWGE